MGWRIVKQPNGLLARFSEVVDDFTHYDMTEDEAIECCREWLGRDEAEEKVAKGLRDEPCPPFVIASGKDDGLDRYRDAVATIRLVHGDEQADEAERLLSAARIDPDADGRGKPKGISEGGVG